MEKNKYEILLKQIPVIELVSLTGQTWYDSNHELYPWTGCCGTYIGPQINDIVYNITGKTNDSYNVPEGYYKWVSPTWVKITGTTAEIKKQVYDEHNILISLDNTIKDLGVLVGWDGYIEQVEQLCNFTYTGATGSTVVTFFNSVYTEKLRKIVEQNYTINFGDGTSGTIGSTTNSSITHTYPLTGGTYEVSIFLESPWTTQKLTKPITVPFDNPNLIDNKLGTLSGYTITGGTFKQDYLNDLDLYTGSTSGTTFRYAAFGASKLDQKKLYGSTGYTSDVIIVTGSTGYTQYVIDGFVYRDYKDGFTIFTGTTVGVTKEEVPNLCLTRNEHFLCFIDEPTIYSDIFVERGKLGVMEKNLRLSEIDNIGELEIYGNGYFKIIKQ